MKTKITVYKKSFTKEEFSNEGFLLNSNEVEIGALPHVMKRLTIEAEPDNHEALLNALRMSFTELKTRSFEFVSI